MIDLVAYFLNHPYLGRMENDNKEFHMCPVECNTIKYTVVTSEMNLLSKQKYNEVFNFLKRMKSNPTTTLTKFKEYVKYIFFAFMFCIHLFLTYL